MKIDREDWEKIVKTAEMMVKNAAIDLAIHQNTLKFAIEEREKCPKTSQTKKVQEK